MSKLLTPTNILYEVERNYSFYGDKDSTMYKRFTSVWKAYWYAIHQQDIDTDCRVFRKLDDKLQEVPMGFLDKNYLKHGIQIIREMRNG